MVSGLHSTLLNWLVIRAPSWDGGEGAAGLAHPQAPRVCPQVEEMGLPELLPKSLVAWGKPEALKGSRVGNSLASQCASNEASAGMRGARKMARKQREGMQGNGGGCFRERAREARRELGKGWSEA